MDVIQEIIVASVVRLVEIARIPLRPDQRLFWVYILASLAIAYLVYRAVKRRGSHATELDADAASGSFLQFVFPKRVWSHPSAWLDLRYFVFHKFFSHFLLLGLAGWSTAVGFKLASGGQSILDMLADPQPVGLWGWVISIAYMFFVMALSDLMAWGLHYLQHRVPLLWQFHKVHHSAEVMHPVSNHREHPIDNLTYGFFISLGFGMVYGATARFTGMVPAIPVLFGIPVLMFLFNVTGYNLRHSHVWLRWPGKWSAVFPSPAHHHVHHSCHPDHIDKNFAFMFPFWDVVFGTYVMPEDNSDVKFGVPEEQGRDLDTVWRLYWVPFRDAYRLFRPQPDPREQEQRSEPYQTPAE